uniref:hypothetical protein n=1 Tax=Nostoc sphaeroides TaxID=446679 RepID=UPI0039773C92
MFAGETLKELDLIDDRLQSLLRYLDRDENWKPFEAELSGNIIQVYDFRILKAKSPKLPKLLTVSWAVEAIARLGGYLEHRSKTPIGIQLLWRGWLKLHHLCVRVASRREGWQLAKET